MCLSPTQSFSFFLEFLKLGSDFVPFLPSPEPITDPETQQRYSTGYIQCMHEVHNLLLSCDWMDKTLGARLLNHLLHSLPKSTPSKPSATNSETGTLRNSEEDEATSLPSVAPPTQTNDPALLTRPPPTKSPHLTALEMWRPW